MTQQNIRNFCIIAHVDHGKSTLADRLLEITNTVPREKMEEQFLDQNPISRRRGITIKLAPVRMKYILKSEFYILNLIDTPGHVDFSYEVSRTLAACEGAILLVDSAQGIQAQTVAHYQQAKKEKLFVIPVINKIDLPNAQTQIVANELTNSFGFKKEEILYISARTGENVSLLIDAIIKRVPPPTGAKEKSLRCLIFDAVYDEFRGVVAYVRVVDGEIKKHDIIKFYQNNIESKVTDVGYFSPFLESSESLSSGEIGYVITGIKDIRKSRVGDTITSQKPIPDSIGDKSQKSDEEIEPLPGYKQPKPMVFFGAYPKDTKDYTFLKEALGKLTLNDTALTYEEEYSSYLGSGFRIGFLGLLHAEIVKERLKQEFNLDVLLTRPQVLYKEENATFLEPYMNLTVYTPKEYVGLLLNLCSGKKASLLDLKYYEIYAVVVFELPYSMFIRGLASDIKSVSKGFASLDYTVSDYKKADLARLEVRVNNNTIDVLSELVYRQEALHVARQKAVQLKNLLPRQLFRQIVQVVVDGNIVAREEIPPFRKDVLKKLSGGDRRRKDKLLEKQKKGKQRLLSQAKVDIPQEALLSAIWQAESS